MTAFLVLGGYLVYQASAYLVLFVLVVPVRKLPLPCLALYCYDEVWGYLGEVWLLQLLLGMGQLVLLPE